MYSLRSIIARIFFYLLDIWWFLRTLTVLMLTKSTSYTRFVSRCIGFFLYCLMRLDITDKLVWKNFCCSPKLKYIYSICMVFSREVTQDHLLCSPWLVFTINIFYSVKWSLREQSYFHSMVSQEYVHQSLNRIGNLIVGITYQTVECPVFVDKNTFSTVIHLQGD